MAIPLFAAGVITTLLQFDITASPPAKTAPNDLLEGTLARSRTRATGGHSRSPP